MLLVHTADIHVGAFSSRPLRNAGVEAFEKITSYVLENNIPYLVISGDFFEKPRIDNYEALRRVYRALRSLREKGVKVLTIPGSHDSSPRGTDVLTLLHEAGLVHMPRFEISDKLVLYPLKLGDFIFYALPGLRNNLEVKFLKEHKVLFKPLGEKGKIIVLAHTSIKFAGYDPSVYSHRYGKAVVEDSEALHSLPRDTSYVALGHIHFPLPLLDEFSGNIAYPGAPIGRDASDLEETYILRSKHGRNRRILLVDLSSDKPFVKSIWDDFGVHVEYYKSSYNGLDNLYREIKGIIRDMPSARYHALILDLDDVPVDERGKLVHRLREIEQQKKILIHLKLRTRNLAGSLDLDFGDVVGDIDEIERRAVEEFVRKTSIKAEPETVLRLIDVLSREKPEDVSESDFYASLYKELKPLLEEILGER